MEYGELYELSTWNGLHIGRYYGVDHNPLMDIVALRFSMFLDGRHERSLASMERMISMIEFDDCPRDLARKLSPEEIRNRGILTDDFILGENKLIAKNRKR